MGGGGVLVTPLDRWADGSTPRWPRILVATAAIRSPSCWAVGSAWVRAWGQRERLPCAHGTREGAKFPLGRQSRALALFGKFSGRNRDSETELRRIRQVSGLTTQT